MMDVSALPEEYRVILQKALRALKASQQHYESGDYDFASSRAYYAAFYLEHF